MRTTTTTVGCSIRIRWTSNKDGNSERRTIMCLYPKLILNRKYPPNKKNGGIPPKCPDERLRYVTAACGKCYECRKQKARAWLVRMSEEMRQNPNALFVTLTITAYGIVTGKQIGRAHV